MSTYDAFVNAAIRALIEEGECVLECGFIDGTGGRYNFPSPHFFALQSDSNDGVGVGNSHLAIGILVGNLRRSAENGETRQ